MVKNVGKTDKGVRLVIGVALWVLGFILYSENVNSLVLPIILGIIGLVLVITAFAGTCPIYGLFKINTNKPKEPDF